MIKTKKITYKVFLFERVKKKISFFGRETYPLQIRLTAGTRTLYLKSYFFTLLQARKYQFDLAANKQTISIEDVIAFEQQLMDYLLSGEKAGSSPEEIRQQYHYFSRDLLQELDYRFKIFLVDFFTGNNLPAYSLFIENDGRNYTSEFILKNLEQSLHPEMYRKLQRAAAEKAPPYIPVIKFFREQINTVLPLLPVYIWQQEAVMRSFIRFMNTRYPEYENPVTYISNLITVPLS